MARVIEKETEKMAKEEVINCKCGAIIAYRRREVYVDFYWGVEIAHCVSCPKCLHPIALSLTSTDHM